MRETHPIDDLFRHALSSASVEPPAEIGDAVLAHVRRKRRRAPFWILPSILTAAVGASLLVGAILFQRGSIAPTGVNPSGADARSDAGSAHRSALQQPATPVGDESGRLQPSGHPPMADRSSEGASGRPPVEPYPATSRLSTTAAAQRDPPAVPPMEHALVVTREPASTEATVRNGGPPMEYLSLREVRPAAPNAPMPTRRQPADYHRARGQWWLAPSLTVQWYRYHWQGHPERLARALEGEQRWHNGIAWGLSAGRTWPSGLRLGAGLEVDRSVQRYRHTERRQVEESETYSSWVTLNTEVFFSDIDTVVTFQTSEQQMEAHDIRIRMRVPVELAWHARFRRWVAGPRASIVAEHTTVQSTASLYQDTEEDAIRSGQLSQAALRMRYPLQASAMVGADLGFMLSERFTLIAAPSYSTALIRGMASGHVVALPERFSLRFQLCHTF